MNEHSPQSRRDATNTTVVVAVVVAVVVFAAILVGALFVFFGAAAFKTVVRRSPQKAVTTASSGPAASQEEAGTPALGRPVRQDVHPAAEVTHKGEGRAPGKPHVAVAPAEPKMATETDTASELSEKQPRSHVAGNPSTRRQGDEEKATTKNYLTRLTPFERVGLKRGEGAVRRPVTLAGRKCESVIGAQPDEDQGVAQVSYMLDGKFAALCGTAGISDAGGGAGGQKPSAVFRIYGDGNLLWESDTLAGWGAAQRFEVGIKGIEVLALVAESHSPWEASRLVWGDVELKAADR